MCWQSLLEMLGMLRDTPLSCAKIPCTHLFILSMGHKVLFINQIYRPLSIVKSSRATVGTSTLWAKWHLIVRDLVLDRHLTLFKFHSGLNNGLMDQTHEKGWANRIWQTMVKAL